MLDDRHQPIHLGATVAVVYADASRGARAWMVRGTVVGYGRSRVLVQFPGYTKPYAVGPEALRVVPG